jgi:hypothetical protein
MNAIDLSRKNGKLPIMIYCIAATIAAIPVSLPAINPVLHQAPAYISQQPSLTNPAFCPPILKGRHLSLNCLELSGNIPLAQPEAYSPCDREVQLAYNDDFFTLGCAQEGFTGYFAPSRWEALKINGDGGVDVTGAPDGLLVEGANSALVSVDAGSTVQWRLAIPAEGYAVFGWRVVGGSNLFSVLVNGRQVLAADGPEEVDDRFFSPLLHPGDQLTLQVSASADQSAAVELSQFRLLTNATGVTCRLWTAGDEAGENAQFTQFITYERPSITQVLFPANRDGIEAPAVSDISEAHPDHIGYPVIDRDGNPDTFNDQYSLHEACGYSATWTDEVISSDRRCILNRHWLVTDDCGSNTMRIVQVIHLLQGAGDCLPSQPGAQPATQPKARPVSATAVLSAAF